MPDSEKTSPGGTSPYQPTLKDQHWRALLSRRPPEEAERDMAEAIEKNDRWRFTMLLHLKIDWASKDNLLRKTIEFERMGMFEEITAKDKSWGHHTNTQGLAGYAAETGRLDFVKLFIEKHEVDIHHYSDELLRNACRHGREDVVEYLLSKGADHAAWNGDPLKEAAENGHLNVVKKLVEAGADINLGNALERAAQYGKKDVVEYLLSKGADAAANNNDAFTTACRHGQAAVVDVLLKHGVSATANDNEALVAACENKSFDVARVLLQHGADVNAQQGRALRIAAYRGETEVVKFLLENEANPNVSYSQYSRETPLTEAVRGGNTAIVRLLMKHGADPAMFKFEALRMARRERKKDIQHAIIDGARAARQQEQDDRLAEFISTFKGGYSVDDLRVKKGPSGDTGLLLAARSGKFADVVRKASGGFLQPADLFHPDDQLDSVLTVMVKNKTLQQFFDPGFWTDRTGAVMDAYDTLPPAFQKRVKLDSIRAQINRNVIMQKVKNAGGGLKPPKITGH